MNEQGILIQSRTLSHRDGNDFTRSSEGRCRVRSFGYTSHNQTLGSGIGEIPVAMGLWLASALFVPGVNLPRLTKLLAEGVLFSVIKTRLIQGLVLQPGWKTMLSPRSLQILGGVCFHSQVWFEVPPSCGSWTSPCLSSSAGLFSLLCVDPRGADFYKFSLGMHCVWQILGRVGGDREYLQAECQST